MGTALVSENSGKLVTENLTVEQRGRLIISTFSNVLSDDEFRRFLERMDEQLRSPVARVLISDHVNYGQIPVQQRGMLVDWRKANRELYKQKVLGVVYVQPSGVVRGALMAAGWIYKPPVDYRIVATMQEALAWADELIKQAESAN